MAESPASGPLHILQSELNGAKSQWEYLHDRLTNGYKDAYKAHTDVLREMEKEELLRQQREARIRGYFLFVASCISVGFAGGMVGGLIAPWARQQGLTVAQAAIRAGVQDATKRLTQQTVKLIVPQDPEKPSVNESLYLPVSQDPVDQYLDQKEELDGCFAIVNSSLQRLINTSNQEQWPADMGLSILDSFRKDCRLLSEAPDPNQLPDRSKVAKGAEILMWIAWTNVRDWDYWSKLYKKMDTGDFRFFSDSRQLSDFYKLNKILARLQLLGLRGRIEGTLRVDNSTAREIGTVEESIVLDMRKLQSFPVQSLPELPFTRMKGLNLYTMGTLELRGKFLDGLRDIRPFHIK